MGLVTNVLGTNPIKNPMLKRRGEKSSTSDKDGGVSLLHAGGNSSSDEPKHSSKDKDGMHINSLTSTDETDQMMEDAKTGKNQRRSSRRVSSAEVPAWTPKEKAKFRARLETYKYPTEELRVALKKKFADRQFECVGDVSVSLRMCSGCGDAGKKKMRKDRYFVDVKERAKIRSILCLKCLCKLAEFQYIPQETLSTKDKSSDSIVPASTKETTL